MCGMGWMLVLKREMNEVFPRLHYRKREINIIETLSFKNIDFTFQKNWSKCTIRVKNFENLYCNILWPRLLSDGTNFLIFYRVIHTTYVIFLTNKNLQLHAMLFVSSLICNSFVLGIWFLGRAFGKFSFPPIEY